MPRPRHPALVDTPRGTFNPEAVGKVRGYAATPEAFDRQCGQLRLNSTKAREAGLLNRRGVPSGWAGRREEVAALRVKATGEAWSIAKCASDVPPDRLDAMAADPLGAATDDEMAAFAMAGLMAVALSETYPTADRLWALKAVLPFLRPVATARQSVELEDGLGWLRGLAAE